MTAIQWQAEWMPYAIGAAVLVMIGQALLLRRRNRVGASSSASVAGSAPSQKAASATARRSRPGFFSRHSDKLFAIVTITLIYLGWMNRDFSYLKAETGIGYALGIIGGVMMLVLLLYPARKRWKPMKRWGATRHWFRLHMILGVLGPLTILFHANFQLGSMNSNVALYCMLLVAGSGLVGRYFYSKIHNGLYGKKTSLEELKGQSVSSKGQLAQEFNFSTQLKRRLKVFEKSAMSMDRGLTRSFFHMMFFRVQLLWGYIVLYSLVKDEVKKEGRREIDTVLVHHWSDKELKRHIRDARFYLKTYMATLRRIGELHFFERMLALWHVLHYPFFLMMVLSAIVHTIAVHMY